MSAQPGYSRVHNAVLDDKRLTAGQKLAYTGLVRFAKDGEAVVSHAQIADTLGLGTSTVHRAMPALRECGYIIWREQCDAGGRPGKHCYTLLLLAGTGVASAAGPAAEDPADGIKTTLASFEGVDGIKKSVLIKEQDYNKTKNALSPPRACAREPAPTASPHSQGAHDGEGPGGWTPLPRTILQVYRRRCGADPPAALCAELRDQLAAVGELGLCRMIDEAADSCGGVVSVGSVRVARLKHEQQTALGAGAQQHDAPQGRERASPPQGSERRRAGGWGRRGGDGTGAPGAARATSPGTVPPEPPEATESDPTWRGVLAELRLVLTAENYARWLVATRVREAAEDHLTVEVRTPMQKDWLGTKLAARIKRVLAGQGKPDLRIDYVVAPTVAGAAQA